MGYKEKNQNFNQVSQFKDDTIYSTEARNHNTLEEGNPINYIFPSEENNSDGYLPPEVQTFSAQLHGPGKK